MRLSPLRVSACRFIVRRPAPGPVTTRSYPGDRRIPGDYTNNKNGRLVKKIGSFDSLTEFGRTRLSENFFIRDFLYSEISNFHAIPNIPDNPELAIKAGKRLCEELLEPLNATFGRIAIRSSFRSSKVNAFGNEHKLNCASNEANHARHIWDMPDTEGLIGATACIAIPWFMDRYASGADWRAMAYWIHDHLPYSELEFFHGEGMCSFNISWHEKPKKNITSWLTPRVLLKDADSEKGFSTWYEGFPDLRNRK